MINSEEINYKWPKPIVWAIVSGFRFLKSDEFEKYKELFEKNFINILITTHDLIERNKRSPFLIARDYSSWKQFYLILKLSFTESKI